MVRVIQQLHNRGFVHRDIKPSNFLINDDDNVPLILIDFGLACTYRDAAGEHLPQENGHFHGTKRYASLNAFDHVGLGRRDDLISWFYSVVELLKGKLPWSSAKEADSIRAMKEAIDVRTLCRSDFGPAPPALVTIWDGLMALVYGEEPKYAQIIGILREHLRANLGCGPNDFAWRGFYALEMKPPVEERPPAEEPPPPPVPEPKETEDEEPNCPCTVQ
jgi:serine/threonine protein kinase